MGKTEILRNEGGRIGTDEKRLKRPNLFVLGAAKCGTTSMYSYLQQHPEVHMSPIKEPSFFCREFQVVRNPIEYFELFECGTEKKVVGEASHVYFSNPDTPPVLNTLFPDARFIVILRNPALRSYSLYQFMRQLGYETIPSFEEALAEEERRFHDPSFLTDCPQYFWNFMYFRSSLYDEQLMRYFSLYERSRFFIMSLTELAGAPQLWMEKIFRFLSVSPDAVIDYTPCNVSDYPELSQNIKAKLEMKFTSMLSRIPVLAGRPLDLDSL